MTEPLFTSHQAPFRLLYKLYFSVFLSGIFSVLYYRVTHVPTSHTLLYLLVSLAELWFGAVWLFQQSLRWAPTHHTAHPDRLPDDLPAVDVLVCTADVDREPPALVANTLISLMAYDYDAEKMAFYLSDDGGSELTFHAVYLASGFAKLWLPFCRKHGVEPRAPREYFGEIDCVATAGVTGASENFRREYEVVKKKYEELENEMGRAGNTRKVPEETRKQHKGFMEWDSKISCRDHPSIIQVLLKGKGGDLDAEGNSMPTLVYVSREKRPNHPHHYKGGALNAMNRVSALISNAPFILNVDCDMHSNNCKTLREAMCFFLDNKDEQRTRQLGFVQFPQNFGGLTPNDLYGNGLKRIFETEFFGTNAHNGPIYVGTGSVHRRESLSGRFYSPDFKPNLESKPVGENLSWSEFEAKAKTVTRCTYEKGKPWGTEMGLMYGCATEDAFTGLVLHSRGWLSVYASPERKAYIGLSPTNTNDTLIQHKRWSTGLLEVFFSQYCPLTIGFGNLKLGQIMCYTFYTCWALWSFPIISYALLLPLALVNGIPLFPQTSDPWFKIFAFLGIASHAFSLFELLATNGTIRMWWNETRMWMMKGTSSYLFSVIVITMKSLGLMESGFEITSKVVDKEAIKRYKKELMEFGVASPMFIPPTTLALLNLYCFLKAVVSITLRERSFDEMALQIICCGNVSLISVPLYEALFLRKDNGRMPTSITLYSSLLAAALLYVFSSFV